MAARAQDTLLIGAMRLDVSKMVARPLGDAHLVEVDQRQPVCGAGPVKYLFPSVDPASIDMLCADCRAAVAPAGRAKTKPQPKPQPKPARRKAAA